jgi:hypothetical protein
MNTLSYRSIPENGLSFVLLVDGLPLGDLVGEQNTAIPHWLIEDDLPCSSRAGAEADPSTRIVTVCSCGDVDCGHSKCRVTREGDLVTMSRFDASDEGAKKVFEFSESNFAAVVSAMAAEAREFRASLSPPTRSRPGHRRRPG